ncbi:WD40/YVTN/BNR-like repeat-containing protein [Maribacter sp. ACAM166]|uniref:WD40/YVTN/BNR-like repeat-containing protein n=1 Tax=Maribacter sp. ACAM166 TaxID=2508996 RepID=UPI0010FCFCE8|nr:glycosyl hydrolase [Maribacter sp. ACAM166]TLP77347.1 glycosyl hydrolase [Maribacter sp. ACAM166]
MKKQVVSLLVVLLTTFTFAQTANDYFKPLKYRNIGPFRGGRSVTATGVIGNPMTYYMGTTGGGLWKTESAGQRWDNISDGFFELGSVGAVSVSASNPNIVYVGMGEHAPRGVMTSYGDGVYKSTDAGNTWTKMGLEKTQHISRIIIHPTNPDIVYVAAQGALFEGNPERGVYKSVDGGITWKNTLFVNELTGAAELSMDANYPEIMYVAMWEHQRKPNMVVSGGVGSGLYKSTDAGETWKKIHKGLPDEKGKMAIAVSPANSNKVYALIESDSNADKGGLFISDNAGESWSLVSSDNRLVQRAWYYIEVFADPNNEDTVYVLSAPALRSEDGGKTWENVEVAHGDTHDLWINPNNSKNMVLADDGGASVSFDYGKTWSTQNNMPTAQFYRISVDNLFPYNIYGGQQDNTSVKIASLSTGSGSITTRDWTDSAGGESAFLAFDPDNPRYVMGGQYLGTVEIMDMESKASTQIMQAPIQYLGREARNMKYLFNWNAPIIASTHELGTYYHGAQFVFRTSNMGKTWDKISPDLTRDIDEKQGNGGGPYTNEAVGAENYGTLAYMLESPHEKGYIWTGSDDGLVHLTKNGGESWENVTPKGLKECLINAIEVSPHDPATAYIATTRYKFNDYTPGLYKTTDYGKTWTAINAGIPYGAFTRVVREDEVKKDLLYAGTEKGMYVSWNGGKNWESLQLNLPVTPIMDLKMHKGDMVVATSGRSFWILDDVIALSQYQPSKKGLQLLKPKDAYNGSWGSPLNKTSDKFKGGDTFEGINPANGVVLYYELPKLKDSTEISLDISNAKGKVIRTISSEKDPAYIPHNGGSAPPAPLLTKKEGLNRFVWDMEYPIMPGIPGVYIEAGFGGHNVSPGAYTFKLVVDGEMVSTTGVIKELPTYETKPGQYEEYDTFMVDAEQTLTNMHNMVNSLFAVQEDLKSVLKKVTNPTIKKEGEKLLAQMKAWDEDMIQRKSQAYDDVENFPNKFTAEYIFLINQTNSSIPRVNQSSKDRKVELETQWDGLKARGNQLIKTAIPAYNKTLWEAGIGAIRL